MGKKKKTSKRELFDSGYFETTFEKQARLNEIADMLMRGEDVDVDFLNPNDEEGNTDILSMNQSNTISNIIKKSQTDTVGEITKHVKRQPYSDYEEDLDDDL